MRTIAHHIEHVRSKPHHVRKQIAFAVALGATAIIALLWLVISLATGAFKIQDVSFAEAQAQAAQPAAPVQNNSLLGAAAAALSGSSDTPAKLEVVGAATTSPPAHEEHTVIPF